MSRYSPFKPVVRSPRHSCRVVCSLGLLVAGLLLAAAPAAASDEPGCTKTEMPEDFSIMDILDDRVAPEVRQANVELLKKHAQLPACKGARYDLGNLYLHGPDLPGNPLPKDIAQARELLEDYGLDGNAFAFAQLAELALTENNAVEAMQWTQVYLYLVTHYKDRPDVEDHRGYNANLLARAQAAWRKSKSKGDSTPGSLLNAYFNRTPALGQRTAKDYKASDEEAAAIRSETGLGDIGLRVKRRSYGGDVSFRIQPGYAIYLMEVQPSGQVTRIAVQTFAPTPVHPQKLRSFVEGWEYYPHRSEEAEILRVPVMYGYPDARLKSK